MYEFVCIHRVNRTMKHVEDKPSYITHLIHRYLIAAFTIRSNDIVLRPFVYNFDVLFICSNPWYVTNTNISPEQITVSTKLILLLLYHFLVHL